MSPLHSQQRTSRYLIWLSVSLVAGLAAFATGGFASRALYAIGALAAVLPLASTIVQGIRDRTPTLALTALGGAIAWLIAGDLAAAYLSLLAGLVGDGVLRWVRARARKPLVDRASFVPPLVRVQRGDAHTLTSYGSVQVGEQIIVERGEHIPVDGLLSVDRARISPPLDDSRLDTVTSGALITAGSLAHDRLTLQAQLVGTQATTYALATIAGRLLRQLRTYVLSEPLAWTQVVWVALALIWTLTAAPTELRGLGGLLVWLGAWWVSPLLQEAVAMRVLSAAAGQGAVLATMQLYAKLRALGTAVVNLPQSLSEIVVRVVNRHGLKTEIDKDLAFVTQQPAGSTMVVTDPDTSGQLFLHAALGVAVGGHGVGLTGKGVDVVVAASKPASIEELFTTSRTLHRVRTLIPSLLAAASLVAGALVLSLI